MNLPWIQNKQLQILASVLHYRMHNVSFTAEAEATHSASDQPKWKLLVLIFSTEKGEFQFLSIFYLSNTLQISKLVYHWEIGLCWSSLQKTKVNPKFLWGVFSNTLHKYQNYNPPYFIMMHLFWYSYTYSHFVKNIYKLAKWMWCYGDA